MLQRRIGMIWTSSGWDVLTSPRRNSRRERALRLMDLDDKSEIIASGRSRLDRAEPATRFADLQRPVEDHANGNESKQWVSGARREAGRRDAAALAAVGRAAVLTRRDLRRQIGGQRRRRAGEHAVVG